MAKGIEIRQEIVNFINLLAIEKKMDISCNTHLNGLLNVKFDVGIYLDTHYALGTEKYLEWLNTHANILFTSCAHKESGNMNEEYAKTLRKLFKSVVPIYKGFAERIIYKCW